ncbi:MAG: AmmeMemoRadiSam system protein B [Actinobacteria bacterium RBG_19FT_COMBO_36_27]|nr:MAG: AmmeMemoRadiSam system protein B [Actinobacteria bacterium RBG_19FT_COMBO_36_27]
MVSVGNIRESVAAGTFYPGNADVLRTQINDFLSNAKSENIKNIKSIICPHAGYIYSGQVAAHSYKQIKGETFDSIFIIAPSHAEYFDFISIFNGDAYRTPLGLVYVDKERSRILADKNPRIELSKYGHRSEHSLEVQLPFLQVLFENIKIVPIVMGQQNSKNIIELGSAIGTLFKNENILIIASTDLSHYYPYDTALVLDGKIKELVNNFDSEDMLSNFLNNDVEMCGGGPVVSAMIASKNLGADSSRILNYKNSGDVTGDRSAVVGYLSAVFYKK